MGLRDYASVLLQEMSPYIKRKFSNMSTLYEIFIFQSYKWLCTDLKPGTIAIDIGANIGDSAIYLAMHKEITKIIAFEPFPELYKQAVANIKASGFEDRIELYNYGIGPENCIIKVPKSYVANVGSSTTKFKKTGGEGTKIITLDEVMAGIASDNVIIKCDCEGVEHSIFNGKNRLDNCYKIQLEYHGGVKGLDDKLRNQGFKVRSEETYNDKILGIMGQIYAERVEGNAKEF